MYHKIIFCFAILFSVNYPGFATVYTFLTAGNFSDVSNWDTYPGPDLMNGDTISIEANCDNIDLNVIDGHLIIETTASDISITNLTFYSNGTMEIKPNNANITINDWFQYYPDIAITNNGTSFLFIYNYSGGVNGSNCLFDNFNTYYSNYGEQDSYLLECLDGEFMNAGIINVYSNYFFLNCKLDLHNGQINADIPFTMTQYGALIQYCSFCTATINNLEEIEMLGFVNLDGNVILNAPE